MDDSISLKVDLETLKRIDDDDDLESLKRINDDFATTVSSTRRKSRIYKQRYLRKWEHDPRFAGWLSQCQEDPDFAYCNVCHTRVLARVASLISHHAANKHKNKMKSVSIFFLF